MCMGFLVVVSFFSIFNVLAFFSSWNTCNNKTISVQNIGFLIIQVWMVRPTDQETTAIKNTVCYSQIPKEGDTSHQGGRGGHTRKHPGWARGQREWEKTWQTPLWWFLWEDQWGRVSGFRTGSFEYFQLALARHRGWFLAVWYLALVWLGQVDSGPECEGAIKEVVEVWALDWLVCIWKAHSQVSLLSQGSLLTCKNWLPLGEAVPSGAGRPQDVKASKTQIQNGKTCLTQLLRHPWSGSGIPLLPDEPGCMRLLSVDVGSLPGLLYLVVNPCNLYSST